jgi:hypothetical protein
MVATKKEEEEFVVLSLLPIDDSSKLIVHSSSFTQIARCIGD